MDNFGRLVLNKIQFLKQISSVEKIEKDFKRL